VRFVIISLPPRAIRDTIEALRRPLNEEIGAREALRYPPHITLRTGLVCPDDKADEVAEAFLDHARTMEAVPVRTEGLFFTSYGPPGNQHGLVGWSVAATEPLLVLHRGLLAFTDWAKGPQGPFRPHVTLAFDDLGADEVERLRLKIQAIKPPIPEFSWKVDHVALYHETLQGWVEWDRASLS